MFVSSAPPISDAAKFISEVVIVGKNAVPIVPAVILVAFKLVTFIVDASKVPLITAASNSALPSELIDQPCEPLEKL